MAYIVKAQTRTDSGKGKVRKLRRSGSLPAVLYGHGDPSLMLTLSAYEFGRLLDEIKGHSPIVDVEIDGRPIQKCIIKTMQRNSINSSLLHVDFQKVHAQEKVTMNVPVILHGAPEGVKQGGTLDFVLRVVQVRATIDMIPEHFDVEIGGLKIGHSFHISDLNRPDLEFVMPVESAIAAVLLPKKIVEETPAAEAVAATDAGPTQPEVLKEKKPTEEEAAEGDKGKGEKGGKGDKGKSDKGGKGAKGGKEEKKEAKKDDKKK